MTWSERLRHWKRHGVIRRVLFVLGWLLILLSPVAGLLPGPGGVFVFAGGAALVLETSPRAKRAYVRLKRRWPKLVDWIDWGLRRKSAKRRAARRSATVCPVAPR